jgi:Protein of unknown function (DUF1569)
MNQRPDRRQLRFTNLDAIVQDAETLLAKGYEKAGNWDLAQCCQHLAEWMRFPVEGFPKAPLPIRGMLWMMKKTVGPKKLQAYLKDGGFPPGKPTAPQTVQAAGGDAKIAIENLKRSVERLKEHTGAIIPSPFFGPMSKDECVGLQLVHCAHHLSFLVPKS